MVIERNHGKLEHVYDIYKLNHMSIGAEENYILGQTRKGKILFSLWPVFLNENKELQIYSTPKENAPSICIYYSQKFK